MAAGGKLKVFRTAIGFDDAYVAVPSKKAALKAWGAQNDLFAMGSAELVSDPKLMKAPLAKPGDVIRLSRGSARDHLRAAGKTTGAPQRKRVDSPSDRGLRSSLPKASPKPRPSRSRLDQAERALEEFEASARSDLAVLRRQEADLAQTRAALESRLDKRRRQLEDRVNRAKSAHDSALSRWRDEN